MSFPDTTLGQFLHDKYCPEFGGRPHGASPGCNPQPDDPYFKVLGELAVLTIRKRAGYSPGTDPFANFRGSEKFGVSPLVGIMIRTGDKHARAASLLASPDNDQVGENLRDTLLDEGNYPLIGVAMMDYDKALAYRTAEGTLSQGDKVADQIFADAMRLFDDAASEEGATEFEAC